MVQAMNFTDSSYSWTNQASRLLPYQRGLRKRLGVRRSTAEVIKYKINQAINQRLTLRQIFTQWVDRSTLHGVSIGCQSTILIRKLIWILAILGGT